MSGKGLGLLGVLLAVGTASRTAAPIPPPPEKPGSPTSNPIVIAPPTSVSATCASDPDKADGPWKAVWKYFGEPKQELGADQKDSEKVSVRRWSNFPENTPVAFLIASVPDPKTTNLSLYFDRVLESVLWATGDSGYFFEQYWLPWSNAPVKTLSTFPDWNCQRQELEKRAEQPGLLVLRRRADAKRTEEVLLVFLVGETPTGGISRPMFENTLNYLQRIAVQSCTTMNEIPLAGPMFSGSLQSLPNQLIPFLRKNPQVNFTIVSGHVTSKSAMDDFNKAFSDGRARVMASIENDKRAAELFFEYVNERWHRPHEVAFLSEDETAFGYLASTLKLPDQADNEKELWLRFPRQIARLRNAYQDADAASQERPESSVVEGVRLTLKNRSDSSPVQLDKDTVEDFSEQQTPASQQAALAGISADLRRERADYIAIFATDVLDSLFLSRYMRLSFPDNRVLTFDSDLLFVREGETAPFTGILSVTNYPLFGRNQHWTRAELAGGIPRRIRFTSRFSEGIYNASRYLLQKDLNWDEKANGEYLLEYSRPTVPHEDRPALWLTALGKDGYWPIALLDRNKPETQALPSSLLHSGHPQGGTEQLHPEKPSRGWFFVYWLALAFSFTHCVYILLLMCLPVDGTASHEPWLVRHARRVRARIPPEEPENVPAGKSAENEQKQAETLRSVVRFSFHLALDSCRALNTVLRVYPDASHSPTGYEIPFLLTATLAIGCVVLLLTLSLSVFWTSAPVEIWSICYGAIAGVALLGLAALAVGLIVRSRGAAVASPAGHPASSNSLTRYWPITLPAIAFAIIFCILTVILTRDPAYATGYFFSYRSLSFTSGVSPAVPVLLLAAGYFYWTWIHLRREGLIWERRRVQQVGGVGLLDPMAKKHMDHVEECLADLFSRKVWRPALLFFTVWLLLLEPWFTARSIESTKFDYLYWLELCLLYWMLTIVWTQFIWCWRYFQGFLQWLERNPIRNAFSRMPKQTSWVPLVSRVREHQLFISARAWDTLRALQTFDQEENRLQMPAKDRLILLQKQLDEHDSRPDEIIERLEDALAAKMDISRAEYGELQKILEQAAIHVRQELADFDWKNGDSDSLQRERDSGGKTGMTPSERLLFLKEEFVAYRYLMFIRYAFRHLRNLLMFVIVGFIFSVISLYSYPFMRLRWIGVVCWLVFLTLGTGVGVVFAEMDRDAILSRLTETKANAVGKDFYLRMLQFGALPLLTLVTTQFPAVGNLVSSWLQPALQALR